MNDEEKTFLVAQETSNLSNLVREKYMGLVQDRGLDFAASAVVGACITSLAVILNTVKKESRDTVIKAVHEQIDQQFKMFEKSLDDFVGEAKQ